MAEWHQAVSGDGLDLTELTRLVVEFAGSAYPWGRIGVTDVRLSEERGVRSSPGCASTTSSPVTLAGWPDDDSPGFRAEPDAGSPPEAADVGLSATGR